MYVLYRVEDDGSTSEVSQHKDFTTGHRAGKHIFEVEDFDMAYVLHTDDGLRIATFGKGRIGYRQWAMRTGRLSPSVDDRYDHDIDELRVR
jgi:hypothetical protein